MTEAPTPAAPDTLEVQRQTAADIADVPSDASATPAEATEAELLPPVIPAYLYAPDVPSDTSATPAAPAEAELITPVVPAYLHAQDALEVLRQLGVAIPDALAAACANDEPLWMAGEQFPVEQIDAALASHTVGEQGGARLKDAMQRLKILQS